MRIVNTESLIAQSDTWSVGIDMMKMLSMMGIVILHIIGHGKAVDACTAGSVGYFAIRSTSIICLCSVNCFALVTGYLSYGRQYRYSKLALLWFRVVFYSILITLLFSVFFPGSVGHNEWVKAIFPVMTNQYWYFTAYFFLSLIIPFVNVDIEKLKVKQVIAGCLALSVFASLFPMLFRKDVFWTMNGFSTIWLLVMYIIGQSVRATDIRISRRCLTIGIIACVMTNIAVIEWLEMCNMAETSIYGVLTSYTSPFVLMMSILLLCLLKDMNAHGLIKRVLAFMSPLVFSVYLIHDNELVRYYLVSGCFNKMSGIPDMCLFFLVILLSVLVFTVCIGIDYARLRLFNCVHIEMFLRRLFHD